MKREKIETLDERDIVTGLIVSERFCREVIPVLKPRYLQLDYAQTVAHWIIGYYREYKKAPGQDIRRLYTANRETIRDTDLQETILDYIGKLSRDWEKSSQLNEPFAVKRALEYIDRRSLQVLMDDVALNVQMGDVKKARSLLVESSAIAGTNTGEIDILNDTELVVDAFVKEDDVMFQFPGALGRVAGAFRREDFVAFTAPMKRGKCLAKGTKVLMADGSVRRIEDIREGERVMGPDSKPRNVLSTVKGRDRMYRVRSRTSGNKKSDIDFTCNGAHILVLKCHNRPRSKNLFDGEVEVDVETFLGWSEYQRSQYRLMRTGVEYKGREHVIPPYLMGLWLGDGTSGFPQITTTDKAILDYCMGVEIDRAVSRKVKNCHQITFGAGPGTAGNFGRELSRLGLRNNKHIHDEYLIDSRENRLQLLAGIIDTDGHNSKDGDCFEISLMNKRLAETIRSLCQQLGFRTTFNSSVNHYPGMYKDTGGWKESWAIRITGRLSEIPLRLERKKREDSKKISALENTFSFSVEYQGVGDYYGFVLDGDHLFLLADTTISHNTWWLMYTALTAMYKGYKVLFFTLEMSGAQMVRRTWQSIYGQSPEDVKAKMPYFEDVELEDRTGVVVRHRTVHRKAIDASAVRKRQKAQKQVVRGGGLKLVALPAYTKSVIDIEEMVNGYAYGLTKDGKPFQADVIVVDYADILAPCGSYKGEYRHNLDETWKRLRGLAQSRKCLVVTASQAGRETFKGKVKAENVSEDIRKLAHVTSMMGLNQTEQEGQKGIMRVNQLAIREGKKEYRQAVVLQCLALGKPYVDSRFETEVIKEDDDDAEGKRVRQNRRTRR